MKTKQVIIMRKDLNMRKGKMCAQAAHASMGVFTRKANIFYVHINPLFFVGIMLFRLTVDMFHWFRSSFKKVVVGVDSEEELIRLATLAQMHNLPAALITDSGLTEFHGEPTVTCLAIGPAEESKIDAITGDLKLL